MLQQRFNADPVSQDEIAVKFEKYAEQLEPYIGNVSVKLDQARKTGRHILFEGAQGTQLAFDHGTYPFVTSSQHHCR